MRCTAAGIQCTPNEPFPLTQHYPCRTQCNEKGDGYIYVKPANCAPSKSAYIDRVCMGDDVYEVNNVNTGKNKPTLIEHCPQGCQNGMCRVFSLTTCTNEGQIGMDFITKCSAICKDGRYAIAPWCDKIDVVGYNNLSTYTAYSALSKLPDTLFDGIERTPLVLSWNMALDVDYEKNSYTSGEYFSKGLTDLPYDYTQITNSWNEPIDEYVVIHEFIHQWVTQKGRR